MSLFMAHVELPMFISQEFIALIPDQRLKLAELMQQRKILSYTLNATRSTLWIVVAAKNQKEAETILAQLPLDKFYSYRMELLMFHETASAQFPVVTLN